MSKVSTLGETPDAVARWQRYVANSDGATIYHDYSWRRIFQSAFGFRPYFLVAEDDSQDILGVLPLYRVPSLFGRPRLVAVPFRDRGGILANDDETFLALAAGADALRREIGAVSVEIKTIRPYAPEAVAAGALSMRLHWVHSSVDLLGVRAKGLDRAAAGKMRLVRQAEAAGLTFAEESEELDRLKTWYGVYQASQRSLGVPPFPRRFFECIFTANFERGAVRLFVVRNARKQVVAATIIFARNGTAIYAYSASYPDSRDTRPNDFMVHRLIGFFIEAGYHSFDFGSDSPAQEGLLRFKRKWLSAQRPVPFYYLGKEVTEIADSSAPQFDRIRAIIRSTPELVSRLMLAPLVRFFG